MIYAFQFKSCLAILFLHLHWSLTLNQFDKTWAIHDFMLILRIRVHLVMFRINPLKLKINEINHHHHVPGFKTSKFDVYIIQFHQETKNLWLNEDWKRMKNIARVFLIFQKFKWLVYNIITWNEINERMYYCPSGCQHAFHVSFALPMVQGSNPPETILSFFHIPSFLKHFKDLFLNIINWKRVNNKTSTWLSGKTFQFKTKGHEFKPP